MAEDLTAQRARNSAGFVGEHPPEAPADPLIGALQAHNKRLNAERVKENKALEAAQRKAFGSRKASEPKAPKARKPRAPKQVKTTPPKTGA